MEVRRFDTAEVEKNVLISILAIAFRTFLTSLLGDQRHVECVVLLCSVAQSCLTAIPWTVAHQAPLSLGFSRPEYWNGLPFPPKRDNPNSGIEPTSPSSLALTGRFFFFFFFTTEPPEKPLYCHVE